MSEHPETEKHEDLGFLQEMVEAVRSDGPQEAQWQAARRTLLSQFDSKPKENLIVTILRKTRSRRIRWAVAALTAACVVALLATPNPWGQGPGQVLAAVAEQLRNAQTVTYTRTTTVKGMGDQGTMRIEMAYKTPGRMRGTMSNGTVMITDMAKKKSLTLMPKTRRYFEIDHSAAKVDESHLNFIENIRTLPDLADEELPERTMDGRTVRGFRVIRSGGDLVLWVEVKTKHIYRVEGSLLKDPGVTFTATDFRFDVELDDSLFSLTPPEGYSLQKHDAEATLPGEEHLVSFLRSWATRVEGRQFPPSLEPSGLVQATNEMKKDGKWTQPGAETRTHQQRVEAAKKSARAISFVFGMEPENDWHYAGKGVKLGATETPICWWKPTGSTTYRVIYADLSIKDVPREELPSP